MIQSRSPCPLCRDQSSEAGRFAFQAHGHAILDCTKCGHRFADIEADETHVAAIYADDYFDGGGAGYDDYLGEGPVIQRHGQWYASVLAKHVSPGRVLDVGAAAGFFLEGLLNSGWTGEGLEPNASMCRAGFERRGLMLHQGTLETFTSAETFDLISMIQVVAHFIDPLAALANADRLTRPGGCWLIETWNWRSFTSRCFGRRWHEYSPPSVLHWFTPDSLVGLAARWGYELVASGRPRKRLHVGHAKELLKHKTAGTWMAPMAYPLVLLPDKLELPYPGDDLFWMLLRKASQNQTPQAD